MTALQLYSSNFQNLKDANNQSHFDATRLFVIDEFLHNEITWHSRIKTSRLTPNRIVSSHGTQTHNIVIHRKIKT